jgi:hypothetical protein
LASWASGENGAKIDAVGSAAIVLMALLVAPISIGAALARERPPIKSVGIVSDWGDRVHLVHSGFSDFSDSEQEGNVPQWGMDDFLAADLEAALKQGYDLQPVSFARRTIAPDPEDNFWHLPSPKENLRKNAKPANGEAIDAYVVIWPLKRPWLQMDVALPGIGLFTHSGSMVPWKNGAWIYASGVVTVVDGHTFEDIDKCLLGVPTPTFATNEGFMRPADDLNVEGLEKMTQAQMQKFEADIKNLLHDEIAHCLQELKLAP